MPRSTMTRARGPRRNSTSVRGKSTKGSRLKKSRTHAVLRYRGPRISRTRLRRVRDDLDQSRTTMSETARKFWIMSEHDIREILTKTEQKIGRAVNMLGNAA
jgi:hypothetical protein